MNNLFLPFTIGFDFSSYFAFNLICFVLTCIFLAILQRNAPQTFKRPSAIVLLIFICIYQLPLILLSDNFLKYLEPYWKFALVIQLTIFISLLYIYFTRRFVHLKISKENKDIKLTNATHLLLFFITGCLLFLFLRNVGLKCTGLYALIFDPEMTLLAREVSTKLNYGSISNLSYGLLSNVLAPLLVVISIFRILSKSAFKYEFLKKVFWLIISIIAIAIVLLPGAKGAIVPIVLAAITAIILSSYGLLRKFFYVCCFLSFLILTLISLELFKERTTQYTANYNYAQCAKDANACESANTLLESLKHRENSIGVSDSRIKIIESNLQDVCNLETKERTPQAEPSAVLPIITASTSSVENEEKKNPFTEKLQRGLDYTKSFLYRAGVVPIQVASWYYQYTSESGSLSIYALPLAKYSAEYINMPSIINNKYGTIYSGGAQVSTGTAPTTFLLSYPAYWSWLGLFLSLTCLFAFELLFMFLLKRLNSDLQVLSLSLVAITCLNFILSDFTTVMISLGGAFIFPLLWAIKALENYFINPKSKI